MSKEQNNASSDSGTETNTGDDNQDGNQSAEATISKSEYDALLKKLENSQGYANRISKDLDSYKQKEQEAIDGEKKQAAEKGDHEKTIKFLTEERDKLKEELSTTSSKFDFAIVDTDLLNTAVKLGCKRPETFIQILRDKFERGEDSDGKPCAKLKGSMAEVMRPDEFLKKELETNYPEWLENPRAEGTGPGKKPSDRGSEERQYSAEDLKEMSRSERLKLLAKDPKLRASTYKM